MSTIQGIIIETCPFDSPYYDVSKYQMNTSDKYQIFSLEHGEHPNEKTIFFAFEQGSYCCEEYGIEVTIDGNLLKCPEGKDPETYMDERLNQTFQNAKFLSCDYSMLPEHNIKSNDDETSRGAVGLVFVTDKGTFTVCFWNVHNGYYPHNCVIDFENTMDIIKL